MELPHLQQTIDKASLYLYYANCITTNIQLYVCIDNDITSDIANL